MPTKKITPAERDAMINATRELNKAIIGMLTEQDRVLAALLSTATITYDEPKK